MHNRLTKLMYSTQINPRSINYRSTRHSLLIILGLFFIGNSMSAIADGQRPASLEYSSLKLPSSLGESRKNLIIHGLKLAQDHGWLTYIFGSADPENGGFDCSGATYYLLSKEGLEPPRSSSAQYIWVHDAGNFYAVKKGTTNYDDPAFDKLLPGDLLFWAGTYKPTDHRKTKVTHVAIYAGQDAKGNHIMLNSSDGRSYLHKKQSGYGVFDFHLPSATSKSTFLGYGSAPKIDQPTVK